MINVLDDQPIHTRSFIFVGGMHKSGTSLMAATLGLHPAISSLQGTGVPRDEGQYVQTELKPDIYYGELLFGLSNECRLNELTLESFDQIGEKLFAQWSKYWDIRKPILLEKSPYNLVRTRFLQKLFTGTHFVMMIRDPRTSYMAARKTLGRITCKDYLRSWIDAYDTFFSDRPYLRSCIDVAYEDLISRPNETISRVLGLLSLDLQLPDVDVDLVTEMKYKVGWNEFIERTQHEDLALPVLPSWASCFGYSLTKYELEP